MSTLTFDKFIDTGLADDDAFESQEEAYLWYVSVSEKPAPQSLTFAEADQKDAAELIADKARPLVQDAIAPWLDQVRNFVEQATSLEEIRDGLIDLYPELDGAAFAEAMGQAMLLSDLAGREEVLQDDAEVAFSEAIESALNGTLDFAAPMFGKGSRAGSKKPNCTAGKSHFCQTPNGRGSCVPMSKKCKFKPSGNTEKAADFVALVVLKKQIEEEINTRKIDLEYADENPSNEAISKWIEARMNAPMGHLEIIHEIANSERGEFSSHLVNVYPSARSYAEKNYKRKQGVTKKARIAELEAEWEAKYATQKAKLQAIDEKAKNGTKSARKEKWDLIFRALPIKAQLEGLKVRLNSGKRKGDIAAGRHYLKSIVRYKFDIEFDLPANYTAADLKSAYRRLAKKYHPDTGGSKEQFDRLTEAYERLSKTEFSEAIEAALDGTLDFAAKVAGKKPNCTAGKSHFCQSANGRGSCVPMGKKCKFKPSGTEKAAADWVGKHATPTTKAGTIATLSPNEILADPTRFQYKILGATTKTGEAGSLSGVQAYNSDLAGIVQVWQDPADGKTYVVNGHNRLALAKRLGAEEVAVRYLKVENAAEARAVGALTNIAEGRGNALDAAKFFKDTGLGLEDLSKKGIPIREKIATDGLALASLEQSLFTKAVNGDLPIERAAIIGGSGLDHSQQKSLYSLVEKQSKSKKITNDVLKELADGVRQSSSQSETQFDLFGSSEVSINNAIERASLQSSILQRLRRDKKLFATVGKKTAATELSKAGNIIDVAESQRVSAESALVLNKFNTLKNLKGPLSDVLNENANRLITGENKKKVEDTLYKQVFKILNDA